MSEEVTQSNDDVSRVAEALLSRANAGRAGAAEVAGKPERADPVEADAEDAENDLKSEADGEGSEQEADTETTEEDEAEEEAEEQPKYTVKINGKEMEVTLDELRAGYMKDGDYREKTASLAEQRRAVEARQQEIADLAEKRSVYLKELEVLAELNNRQPVAQEQLDELLKTNPAEYIRAKAANDQWAQNAKLVRDRIDGVKAEIAETQKVEFERQAKNEADMLLKAVPELAQPEAKQKLAASLVERGFTKEQIEQTLDHRLFVMAEEARRYREIVARGKEKPVAKVPKVTQGKASSRDAKEISVSEIKAAEAKARKTGSVEDVANLLLTKSKARS